MSKSEMQFMFIWSQESLDTLETCSKDKPSAASKKTNIVLDCILSWKNQYTCKIGFRLYKI